MKSWQCGIPQLVYYSAHAWVVLGRPAWRMRGSRISDASTSWDFITWEAMKVFPNFRNPSLSLLYKQEFHPTSFSPLCITRDSISFLLQDSSIHYHLFRIPIMSMNNLKCKFGPSFWFPRKHFLADCFKLCSCLPSRDSYQPNSWCYGLGPFIYQQLNRPFDQHLVQSIQQ